VATLKASTLRSGTHFSPPPPVLLLHSSPIPYSLSSGRGLFMSRLDYCYPH
jgi:hypothetical protein